MREWNNIYYSSLTGLLDALTEAGYPISKQDFKTSFGKENAATIIGASEESLCLTLYCALGILLEKGYRVNLGKSNAHYIDDFPAVEIKIEPFPNHNTIVRGRPSSSSSSSIVDDQKINVKSIHNGQAIALDNNVKSEYSTEINSLIIYSKGRGKSINKKLSTILYLDAFDRNCLSDIFNDIQKYPLKFFRSIILKGKYL
uniref:Uncharacterized protein n=1 Tax=Metapenaeus ensis majanivirus TaxID=2984279 RepID=A0A9C7F6W1_9VIRU|nr:MAG: hypothetical protein [Metapenaeus ensis majanivirus]